MISICIPIHNFNVTGLVFELQRQGEAAGIPFQIILVDDASENEFRTINKQLDSLTKVEYHQLEENIGRSKIRNLLAKKSNHPYLIYLDCDSKVENPLFIQNYIAYLKPNIVCMGGRLYREECPENEFRLHWTVGSKKETASAIERSKHPNRSFISCNFLIDKSVFNTVKFDERLTQYGSEDTLFGLELKKCGIEIIHIDNPAYHIGLEDNVAFLTKTEIGILNIHKINRLLNEDRLFIESVKVLNLFQKLKKTALTPVISFFFQIFRNSIKKNLLGKRPNLRLFDFYKLGYMCCTRKQKTA